MGEETGVPIISVVPVLIAIIFLVVGATCFNEKLKIDAQNLIEHQNKMIYALLIEATSTEQGIIVYDRISRHYNISLDSTNITTNLTTGAGTFYHSLTHHLDELEPGLTIDPNIVRDANALCIVKKVDSNCHTHLTICDANDLTCCSLGADVTC